MKYHASQFLLPLTQTVMVDRGISLVCIPDRDTAECALTRLRAKHGPALLKAVIRKDRPGQRSTYTLRYFVREAATRPLF